MKNLFVLPLVFFAGQLLAEKPVLSNEEYVGRYKQVAVQHMLTYKIPASITMAQAILESGSGNSDLAQKGNNHFGIKCHDWTGEKMFIDDDQKDDCFRVYKNAEESYEDHSLFLTTKPRYAGLFKLEANDYKAWAEGLKTAGYATNPKYPQLLTDLIERLKLNELDQINQPQENAKNNSLSAKSESTTITNVRSMLKHENRVKYVVAKKGDTYYRIAKEFDMGLWQLYQYNDLDPKKDCLEEGDLVYLQPKRNKGLKAFIVLEKPMTLNQVSQIEAVKIKSLLHKNQLEDPNKILPKGEKVILR
jgi:LysM repeat protein